MKRIQGTWLGNSLEENGVKRPAKVVIRLVFQGDTVKMKKEDEEEAGTFHLDPTQKPKAVDLVMGGQRIPGIYTLEADRLTICLDTKKNGKRPTRFATDAKTAGLRLMTLKRQ